VVIILFLVTLVLWDQISKRDSQAVQAKFEQQQALIELNLSNHINETARALERMAERWEKRGGMPFEEWQADAENYLSDFNSLKIIGWVDPDYIIRWVTPLEGNENAVDANIDFESPRRDAFMAARENNKTVITPPLDLMSKGRGIAIFLPLFYDEEFQGLLTGIYDTHSFIGSRLNLEFTNNFNLKVTDNGAMLFETEAFNSQESKWETSTQLPVMERIWKIDISAKDSFITAQESHWANMSLIMGILISCLTGFAVYSALTANDKNRLLEQTTNTLKVKEEDQRKLLNKLAASNEELAHFAYICSHDLQEPLRMIRSFSQRLQTHLGESLETDAKGKKYFHFITDGASRAQILIQDILSYSQIDNATQQNEIIPLEQLIDLEAALDESENVRVTHDSLPTVKGNRTQLYQLFQNLINNGLKYQKDNVSPHVHISAKEFETHWQISIRDNGIGIADKHQGKIFEIFKRLHRRTEYSGTGIGLAICKKVVERHGGEIWVESAENIGSTFTFTLPKTA